MEKARWMHLNFTMAKPMYGRIFLQPGLALANAIENVGLGDYTLPTLNNISPLESAPLIYNNGRAVTVRNMRWSFHAASSRKPPSANPSNVVVDCKELLSDPLYQTAMIQHRGVVPTSAYVEWETEARSRQPYYIQGLIEPLLLPAIWNLWQGELYSFAIVTKSVKEKSLAGEDCLPVFMTITQARRWMDLTENVADLLNDFNQTTIEVTRRKISNSVNDPENKASVRFL